MNKTNPVGVIDLGYEGLSMVKKINHFLPNEKVLYFSNEPGDDKKKKTIKDITEFASAGIKFMINKNVKIIVIVSKLISEKSLKSLRKEFNIPLVVLVNAELIGKANSGNEAKNLEDSLNGMGLRCPLGAEATHEFYIIGNKNKFINLAEEKLGKIPHFVSEIKN